MKTTYEKLKPRIVNYRDYKNFCNDTFRQMFLEKLSTKNINTNCSCFEKFLQICIDTHEEMNKSFKKAHMKRS